jgi:hypothetical protein
MGQGSLYVWGRVAAAPVGQGSLDNVLNSDFNPPRFILDAAKEALDRVDCNQYSPTKVPSVASFATSPTTKTTKGAAASQASSSSLVFPFFWKTIGP